MQSQKIKMEIAARQREALRILFDGVEASLINRLKENEEEILDVGKLNVALQERAKSLNAENQLFKHVENIMEAMTRSQNVNTTLPSDTNKGLPASGGVVADSMNNSGKNEERGGQRRKSATTAGTGGDVAGKGDKLVRETEANSRCRMCKKCGERESCVLVLPCKHLCLCTLCSEANLEAATCPGCNSLIKEMVCVSLT